MGKRIHYTEGQLVGDCIYISETDPTSYNGSTSARRTANFLCRCGKEFKSVIDSVKRRATVSCGCVNDASRKIPKRVTHGLSKTKPYKCWVKIKQRCNNPNSKDYVYYGARGIKVCQSWLESFEAFYEDVGKFHQEGLELDRIDVNGDYTKENCRWVDESTQSWNQRVYSSNKTGCAGVSVTKSFRYEVRISKNGKEFYIGTYDTLEEAIVKRKEAEVYFYGESLDVKRS